MKATPLREFAAGARDTIPMMIGAAPFGVIFGTLVTASPLTLWHGQLMSLVVFAGSAQFIAVGLIASHASFAVILATTLVVNLRHVLYSATLAPYVAHLPRRWRWALAGMLTDEVFAVAYAHYRKRAPGEIGPHYFFGSGVAMYLNWQLWTPRPPVRRRVSRTEIARARLRDGRDVHRDRRAAARRRALVAAALASGVLSFAWQGWPYKLGLLAAVFVGVAVGMLLTLMENRPQAKGHAKHRLKNAKERTQ